VLGAGGLVSGTPATAWFGHTARTFGTRAFGQRRVGIMAKAEPVLPARASRQKRRAEG
jgi:hypothetical protein